VPPLGTGAVSPSPGRARVLTPAEKVLVGQLLAGGNGPITGQIPRSTRQAATSRIYQRDWVRDRYVPNPELMGWPWVTFSVTQPYAEKVPEVTRTWRDLPCATVLWGSHRTLFGVYFSRDKAEHQSLRSSLSNPEQGKGGNIVSQDLARSAVPVYFDFEAAWARVCGNTGSAAYPQSLPRAARPTGEDGPHRASATERATLGRMVIRPFVGSARITERPSPLRASLRAAERRCLRTGWVEARSFLNPIALAREVVEFPKQVVFIQGSLLASAAPANLFRELVQTGGVSPFLFATDGNSVLLGALSTGRRLMGDPSAASAYLVLSTLKRHLESITLLEEDLGMMEVLVDHRYDRLVSP
jgi:hypothetical protein